MDNLSMGKHVKEDGCIKIVDLEKYHISNYQVNKYESYSKIELVYFCQEAKKFYLDVLVGMGRLNHIDYNVPTRKELIQQGKLIREAEVIKQNWETFKQCMEDNPDIKEEYNTLLMILKLIED